MLTVVSIINLLDNGLSVQLVYSVDRPHTALHTVLALATNCYNGTSQVSLPAVVQLVVDGRVNYNDRDNSSVTPLACLLNQVRTGSERKREREYAILWCYIET